MQFQTNPMYSKHLKYCAISRWITLDGRDKIINRAIATQPRERFEGLRDRSTAWPI